MNPLSGLELFVSWIAGEVKMVDLAEELAQSRQDLAKIIRRENMKLRQEDHKLKGEANKLKEQAEKLKVLSLAITNE